MMIKLRYGNTNTFYIRGSQKSLLVDTDYAGTMPAFYKALKDNSLKINDIDYVLATHYHPDHMGLISTLMQQGVRLLLIDVQKDSVHFSDPLFAKDGIPYAPIDASQAEILSCEESRNFLSRMGISGEIIYTPSHNADSITLVLDDGNCFVGDLEPYEYIEAYENNVLLKTDWDHVLTHDPKRLLFAHMPERTIQQT